MVGDRASDQGSGPMPPIGDRCRAKRIAEVVDFAQCLVEPESPCPNGFMTAGFFYCLHPQREGIIARTLAGGESLRE